MERLRFFLDDQEGSFRCWNVLESPRLILDSNPGNVGPQSCLVVVPGNGELSLTLLQSYFGE